MWALIPAVPPTFISTKLKRLSTITVVLLLPISMLAITDLPDLITLPISLEKTKRVVFQVTFSPKTRHIIKFTRLKRKWQSIEEKSVPDFQYNHANATPRNQSGRNVQACRCTAANTAPETRAAETGKPPNTPGVRL